MEKVNKNEINDAKWENWLILISGIWLCSIPWVLSFGFEKYELNVIMWNFLMIGSCVVATSVISLKNLRVWTEWLSLFMGVWLFFSPLFLLYYGNQTLLWNSLLFGALIAGLSALSIPLAEKKRVYNRMLRKNKALNKPIQH
jgi:hypothetical protein